MTTTSLLSITRYSPRASRNPWLMAAGKPRFVALLTIVTGTAASVAHAGQIDGGPVGRPVIDDDQLPGGPGVVPEARRCIAA